MIGKEGVNQYYSECLDSYFDSDPFTFCQVVIKLEIQAFGPIIKESIFT